MFRAVADPTRRAILDILSAGERSVGELTASFSISQPAVSQHLRELREARLVRATRLRRERRYSLTPEPLAALFDWTNRYRRFFDVSGHAWAFVEVPGVREREAQAKPPSQPRRPGKRRRK